MKSGPDRDGGREFLWHGLFLLALLVVAFPGVFLRGEIMLPGDILFESPPWSHYAPPDWEHAQNRLASDLLTAFLPYHYVTKQALKHGEWPLWNPFQLTGLPLLANCQSAVFHPPRLLFDFLDLYLATTVYILLKLWLMGMTAYLCARTLKFSIAGARFASVAWMLSGFNFVWCNWAIPNVSIWFPLVFMGTELLLDGRYRRGFFATALGGTLCLLAGHPETALVMGIGLSIYLALRILWSWRDFKRHSMTLALWGGAWALALAVAAPQVLPFLEYLHYSFKSYVHTNVGPQPGYPAGVLACFWAPRFYGTFVDLNYWGDLDSNRYGMAYAGIPVWLGLTLLLARAPKDRPGKERVVCLALTCFVLIMVAFEVPPFSALHRLPFLELMKKNYHIAFVMFALPLLGAIGLDRWFSRPRKWREVGWWVLGMAIIAVLLGIIYRFNAPLIRMLRFEDYLHRQIALSAGFQLLCLLVILASVARYRPRLHLALLTLILAADLLVAGHKLNTTMPREQLYPDTKLTRFLQEQPKPCRFGLREGLIAPGLMTPYGIEDLSGYDGLYPDRIMRFQHTLRQDVWNAMEPVYGVEHYLHDPIVEPMFPLEQEGRFELVTELDGIQVYKNNRALPRAFLVGRARVVPDVDEMFEVMRDPAFDPGKEALLEAAPPGPLPEARRDDLGQARVVRRTTTRVTVEADAAEDCVLVLSDAYYPGWKAKIDGVPAALFPVYYAFRGLLLPAGEHTVEYRYAPLSFYGGLAISVGALSASILASLAWVWRKRARP